MGTPVGVWLVVGSLFFFGTIGVTAGCGSGSSGGGGNGGLDTDCPTACNKVAAACGGSVDECVSSCEDTSSFPSSCLSEAEDLTNCAATTGTVTCTSGGQYQIDGCTSPAEAFSNCASGGSSGGGSTCPSGSYSASCTNIQCTSTEITASCMTNDDTFVSTQLALPCASVSNCDGQLTCSASC